MSITKNTLMNAHLHLGLVYLQTKTYEKAISEFQPARVDSGDPLNIVALLGTSEWQSGNRGEAQKILERLNKQHAEARDLAIIYTGFDNKERALESLEKAYQDHSWLMLLIKSDPYFDSLRREERFQNLINRVGL